MSHQHENKNSGINWPLLAVTRFALAFIVLCNHLQIVGPKFTGIGWLAKFGGFSAVCAFLIISGISINHSITTRPKGYLMRRIDRIYPTYIVAVIATILLFVLFGPVVEWHDNIESVPSPWQMLGNALMLQTFFVKPFLANNPLWTLATECFFYLCAPLIVRLPRPFLWCMVFVSAAICASPLSYGGEYWTFRLGLFNPLALCWAWLLGFLFYENSQNSLVRSLVVAIPTLVLAAHDYGDKYSAILAAAAGILIANSTELKVADKWKVFCLKSGDLSYPLYAIHYPALIFLYQYLKTANVLLVLVYVAWALLIAAVVHWGVELPYQRRQKARAQKSNKPSVPHAEMLAAN